MRNLINNTSVELLTNNELTEINGGDIFGIQYWYYEEIITLSIGLMVGLVVGFSDSSEHY